MIFAFVEDGTLDVYGTVRRGDSPIRRPGCGEWRSHVLR